MNGLLTYPNGVIPGALGQIHDRGNTSKDAALLGSCLRGAGAIAFSGVARCRCDDDDDEMVINRVHARIGAEITAEETDADRDLVQCQAARSHELLDMMAANVRRSTTGQAVEELSLKAKSRVGQLRKQNRGLTETGEYTACSRFFAKQVDHISRMAAL